LIDELPAVSKQERQKYTLARATEKDVRRTNAM